MQRAQGKPDAVAPAAWRAKDESTPAKSPQVQPDQSGLPRASGFNGFLRALPGVRDLLSHRHRRDAEHRCQLSASQGAPGPHDFAVRAQHHSSVDMARPSHPAPYTRDDREAPLLSSAGRGDMPLIWGFEQRRRHAAEWRDGQFADGKHARIARRAKWPQRLVLRCKTSNVSLGKILPGIETEGAVPASRAPIRR